MSRRGIVDVFQTKTTRSDRYSQMSHQEKLIEQKKKEIQAKVEQKRKSGNSEKSEKIKDIKSYSKSYNQFSNDGSFLDQFKQMKDKKIDQKLKSFKFSQEKSSHSEDRNRNNRWSHRRHSPSPISSRHKFLDKFQNNEPKISISTSYSNFISQANFNVQTSQCSVTPENVVGQPLLKNDQSSPNVTFSPPTQASATVISALPLMLNAPPPQIIQQNTILMQQPTLPPTAVITSEIQTPAIITSLNLPLPTSQIGPQNAPDLSGATLPVLGPENSVNVPTLRSMSSVELASIPSPNPLQLQSIPQPEPINTMNIPPPAPLQVQNIPPPSPIQLNEIPKPKPIDIINIPTPTEVATNLENGMSDPDFIKNIPPPNKSIPPPSIQDTTISANISVPPPDISNPGPTCMPPPNVSSQNVPPPPSMTLLPPSPQSMPPPHLPQSVSSLIISENVGQPVMTPQTIIVHSVPPPSQNIQSLQLVSPSPTIQNLPPQLPLQTTSQTLPPTSVIPVTLTLQTGTEVSNATETNVIISQQLLQGNQGQISVATPNLNIHYPPPIVSNNIQGLQQTFISQPPPITNHNMPPMNIPPPASIPNSGPSQDLKSLQAVYSSGTAEYEAMVSLGRMVAQCGPGIEDIVRQRKQQDPHLWFLFHKDSAAYRQYQQLVEQFNAEAEREKKESRNVQQNENNLIKGENSDINEKDNDQDLGAGKRRKRSRWGEKDQKISLPPMMVVASSNESILTSIPINIPINPAPNVSSLVPVVCPQKSQGSVLLTSLTRNDPAFIQYVKQTYTSIDLTEEDWKKAEDNFKVSLLYQEMLKKKQEVERLTKAGKHKYDYDSDEETDGGTWEHKLREKEMQKTQTWAGELTKNAEGKHHIGDFLPPEELQKFLDKKGKGPNDGSDYKDFKIKEDNIGFKMLQKLGWSEGQGLGATASGIVDPVNKALIRDQNQGLGLATSAVEENDDEYESYRKRMMLAYRFRPNPLNNPRRPYY